MNLDKLRGWFRKAERIERGLESGIVDESFDAVREKIVRTWAEADLHDKEGQQKAKIALYVLDQVRADMRSAISKGKVAAKQLDEARKQNNG